MVKIDVVRYIQEQRVKDIQGKIFQELSKVVLENQILQQHTDTS